jgi:predicted MFS family arabinose efflux permease
MITTVAACSGGVAVMVTMAFGAVLGYRRRWRYLAWAIVGATALVGMFVFFTFAGSQPSNAPDDPGFGLGALLVTAALVVVIAILLWLGGGIGLVFRSVPRSHHRVS